MKEHLLGARSQIVVNEKGELIVQIDLTEAILKHEANKHLGWSDGWREYTGASNNPCGQKPPPREGEVGDWACIDNQWVWIPFIG